MALSVEAKDWFQRKGLKGFIRVAEAQPHKEPEKVATTIDIDGISKAMVQAAIEIPSKGLQSIENPSTDILTEYFGEFLIVRKAYQIQGGENPLFLELARVLLEYGFVHPRPLAMPKNYVGV